MRKREFLRAVPGLSMFVTKLEAVETKHQNLLIEHQALLNSHRHLATEHEQLKKMLHHSVFADDNATFEPSIMLQAEDGFKIPPAPLRYLVTGTEDRDWFLTIGKAGSDCIRDVLTRNGADLIRCRRVLDFGCGCGRVTRHLVSLFSDIFGCDCNQKAIEWCQKNLPFGRFVVNSLVPPLPYANASFDLICAFSVFTHWTEPLQELWIEELHRILAPTGYLILSTLGDGFVNDLSNEQREVYDRGSVAVIRFPDIVGTNYCMAYQSEHNVRKKLSRKFEVLDFMTQGAVSNPPQDLYLFRPALA